MNMPFKLVLRLAGVIALWTLVIFLISHPQMSTLARVGLILVAQWLTFTTLWPTRVEPFLDYISRRR